MREGIACALTVAGTDPSGAAGIQVDLAVFRELGVHGLSAITAVVWQNTQGVRGYEVMPPKVLEAQLDAVFDDFEVSVVKVGMVPDAAQLEVIARVVERQRARGAALPLVCDPVLASGDGAASLARQGVVQAYRERLMPLVDVLTPNVPEAVALLEGQTFEALEQGAQALLALGAKAVLLKAGHWRRGEGEAARVMVDCWADGEGVRMLPGLAAIDEDVRGTGCQLSSALAAGVARGHTPYEAALEARVYLNALLHQRRVRLGRGRAMIVRALGEMRG